MNMMKALIPSAILTLIISAIVGFFGMPQAYLNLQSWAVAGVAIYWSWTLFFIAMAINGALVIVRARGERDEEPDALPQES